MSVSFSFRLGTGRQAAGQSVLLTGRQPVSRSPLSSLSGEIARLATNPSERGGQRERSSVYANHGDGDDLSPPIERNAFYKKVSSWWKYCFTVIGLE